MKKRFLYILSVSCILAACQDTDDLYNSSSMQDGDLINVGGISVDDVLQASVSEPSSRATDDKTKPAETQTWLITPLKQGLDITYGKVGAETTTERVAILKLLGTTTGDQILAGPSDNQYAVDKDTEWAAYSFRYRETEQEGEHAWWHGNGAHYFEGQYVPQTLRFGAGTGNASSTKETVNTTTAPGLHSNQTNNLIGGVATGNYDLLAQYLGMPASTRLSATVARIMLPFRHRLCRVLAYVLIDPALGSGVTLEGYKKTDAEKTSGKDDPETTELHFSNVDVLAGVKDEKDATGHHTLTPEWMTARKVIPHFNGESGSRDKDDKLLDDDFIVYMDIDEEIYYFPTDDSWAAKKAKYDKALSDKGNNVEEAEKACKIRKINYGKVPVYDIIARPTYSTIDNVMYDEAGVKNADGTENLTKKQEYLALTNKIDFDLTLSNGLQYSKSFKFDLDANFQTVVYLRIGPESVDYNSSGSELWKTQTNNDDWYGVDNQNGNSLSIAGSSWQRAYTFGKYITDGDKVTDGGFYNETTPDEDGTSGQYLTVATWKKHFAQAYKGGEHHGDYFILHQNITIDASELPQNFVFTGHLDANGHTITFTGSESGWAVSTLYNEEHLYKSMDASPENEFHLPELYIPNEVAQSKSRSPIQKGDPMMEKVVGKTLYEIMTDGVDYYCKDEDNYTKFVRPSALYRTNPSCLFAGLDGIYTTTQENVANPYAVGVVWEANVHKEKNDKGSAKEYWVPYKGTTSGWRAEVINTKVKGTMFGDGAVITGNVQNCYDGANADTKITNHTPEYPKYK